MLVILTLISLSGFFLSKYFRLGPFNPFTLYFGVWSAIFVAYAFFQHTYRPISEEYLFIQICVQLIALFMMVCTRPFKPGFMPNAPQYQLNKKIFTIIQLALIAALPTFYQMVVDYAGESIFTSSGYTRLRYVFNNEGKDMGKLGYLYTLAFLSASVGVYYAAKKELNKWQAMLAVLLALIYAYLTTGRTFFLMIFIFTVTPLAVMGKIRLKTLAVLSSVLLGMFFLVAALTSKGASADASLSENAASFIESAHSYFIAPFVALSMITDELKTLAFGDYSLRFILSILSAFGLTDPPGPIVKGYQFTPAPTNLYTVYEVYVRDFYVFGFFIPLIFLPIHWILYKQARKTNDFCMIIYAISLYPLLTQMLQDQYMTLISTWIQMFLGCLLLISRKRT
ncbi:O-antigen polymerase [Neisseria wadsworthii]|uniref:Oligosaccharide repeat unit polymerase n=1 Tax=Neisseria wadsworthii 9715 TaxID=1030841 RepID=G4CR24_9NEIS|nr:O-antigen polymerase [Neisseria wadsworthii]EGZ45584.1 hypothetical protein HMPREF9370_1534 [Neisseria wadsworthii 9715]QMT35243.1 oligosaccharide repeat unit polymerase [Neisseria wadsworthii]